ncbi:MAG: hypothetical protein HQK99_17675, partial [Nitrospirae bacterium]|nr:hypothetical protein [Nitrospirota bacterium]
MGQLTQWGSYGSGNGQLNYPDGIAIDSNGYVYVFDSGNYRVQKFTSDGTFVTKWGSAGTGDGQFTSNLGNAPGIAVDSSGFVYVVDSGNYRVQKFTSDGTFVTKWGSSGSGDGQFNYPWGIAVDSSGYVYVSDGSNRNVQKFKSSNIPTTYNFTVTKSGTGSGSVTTSSGTLSWSGNIGTWSGTDTSVALGATADTGSTFTSWSGCDSTSGSQCTVVTSVANSATATPFKVTSRMAASSTSAQKNVTVTFTATPTYTITITKAGTGSGIVTPSSGTVSCIGNTCTESCTSGTTLTFLPTANSGSTFSGWSGCDSSSSSGCTISCTANKSVISTFTLAPTSYTLTVTKSGTGSGTVTADSGTIAWSGSTGTASYTSGTSVVLTAAAISGSTFASWSGCDSSSGTQCTV